MQNNNNNMSYYGRYDADNLVAKNRAAADKRSEIHDEFTGALKEHSARIAANRRRKVRVLVLVLVRACVRGRGGRSECE